MHNNSRQAVSIHLKEFDMSRKTVAKYLKLYTTVEPIFVAFPSLYIVEFGFNHVTLFTKQIEKQFENGTC